MSAISQVEVESFIKTDRFPEASRNVLITGSFFFFFKILFARGSYEQGQRERLAPC